MEQPKDILKLSARDAKAFTEALLNPPEPGPRLKAAAKRYLSLQEENCRGIKNAQDDKS